MNRRTFLSHSMIVGGALTLSPGLALAQGDVAASPEASPVDLSGYPELEVIVKDDGFAVPTGITAGRYHVVVRNQGTQVSHSAMGRLPDAMTDDQLDQLMQDNPAGAGGFTFNDIGFVGMADWPPPGGTSSGIIDLIAGKYILFDPFGARGIIHFEVSNDFPKVTEVVADVTVGLVEMAIDLPVTTISSANQLWKIENQGEVWHEMAILALPQPLTGEQLLTLFSLPDDATPPPGLPALEYNPVKAIGLIAAQHSSWVEVFLDPGHYVAICAAPDENFIPHVMLGMFAFLEVE